MARTLYEINNDYLMALESSFLVDEETGEIIFREDALNKLEGEFKDKADNICCYIKDLESLTEAIKNEKKALDERLKANESRVDSLKKYLSESLKIRAIDKLETPRNKISFRTSKSVDVLDESMISDDYWKEEVVKKLDKKTILEALKNGEEVKGCSLLVKSNLQIK